MSKYREVIVELADPLMDGGSASVNGPRAWQAFIEFADQDTDAVQAVG